MFHFPTFPPHTLCIQMRVAGHDSCRVSPFGHPRISARLTAPRGLSQPPTSFIGSWCQGIHHVLFITLPQRCSRPLYSSQRTTKPQSHTRHPPTPVSSMTKNRPEERHNQHGCPLRTQQRTYNPRPRTIPVPTIPTKGDPHHSVNVVLDKQSHDHEPN